MDFGLSTGGTNTKEETDGTPGKSVVIKMYSPFPDVKWIHERKSGAKQSTVYTADEPRAAAGSCLWTLTPRVTDATVPEREN